MSFPGGTGLAVASGGGGSFLASSLGSSLRNIENNWPPDPKRYTPPLSWPSRPMLHSKRRDGS